MEDLGVTDLASAFDVIHHTILLKKIEDLGVRMRAMQAYFVKSNVILESVGYQPPNCPQAKIWKPVKCFMK